MVSLIRATQLCWKLQKSFIPSFPYCHRFKTTYSNNVFPKKRNNFKGSNISKRLAEDLQMYTPVHVRNREINGTTRWIALPLMDGKNVFNVFQNNLLNEIKKAPEVYLQTIFMSTIDFQSKICTLKKTVEFTEVDKITNDLLCLFQLDQGEFKDNIKLSLPSSDWSIPPEEYTVRKTFDDDCIFTIDPPTAKDLDDAIHVNILDNGLYEIGVHIADVSYFVKENGALDREASLRSTSIYMADRVIPMLPEILSEKLCSLSQECEKLAMTCLITLNSNGDIVEHKFVRSIIHSSARLSYTEADRLIELSNEVKSSQLNEQNTKIVSSLKTLNELSKILRSKRVTEGALSLEKSELEFEFSKSSTQQASYPTAFKLKSRGASSLLVEELMLLANKVAAMNLVSAFYGKNILRKKTKNKTSFDNRGSFLRRHPPPQEGKMKELRKTLQSLGYTFNLNEPASLSRVLREIGNESNHKTSPSLKNALYFMTYFRMQMALYFCLEHDASQMDYDKLVKYSFHYGLSTPLYTHFTSPIRRYADLVVHRKLIEIHCAQSKNEEKSLPVSLQNLKSAALTSNYKRLTSRRAKFLGDKIYLAAFLKKSGPMNLTGYVVNRTRLGLHVLFGDIGIAHFVSKNERNAFSLIQITNGVQLIWAPQGSCYHELSLKFSFLDPLTCTIECEKDVLDLKITPNRPLCPVCDKDVTMDTSSFGIIVDTEDNQENLTLNNNDKNKLSVGDIGHKTPSSDDQDIDKLKNPGTTDMSKPI